MFGLISRYSLIKNSTTVLTLDTTFDPEFCATQTRAETAESYEEYSLRSIIEISNLEYHSYFLSNISSV